MNTYYTEACDEFPTVLVQATSESEAIDLIAEFLSELGFPDFRNRAGFSPDVLELDDDPIVIGAPVL